MDFRLEHLDQLTVTDLEEYMEYLKYRFNENNKEVINKERGIMRKISSLKSFYNYFFRVEKIKTNPAQIEAQIEASLAQLKKNFTSDPVKTVKEITEKAVEVTDQVAQATQKAADVIFPIAEEVEKTEPTQQGE